MMQTAQYTAQGLYGSDYGGQGLAGIGIAVPAGSAAPGAVVAAGQTGTGTWLALPRDFWRSSGFGLIVLVLLVVYFDVRLLNR